MQGWAQHQDVPVMFQWVGLEYHKHFALKCFVYQGQIINNSFLILAKSSVLLKCARIYKQLLGMASGIDLAEFFTGSLLKSDVINIARRLACSLHILETKRTSLRVHRRDGNLNLSLCSVWVQEDNRKKSSWILKVERVFQGAVRCCSHGFTVYQKK